MHRDTQEFLNTSRSMKRNSLNPYVCMYVTRRDSCSKNYPNNLKFGTNIYALYVKLTVQFLMCIAQIARVQGQKKYLNTLRPMEGNSLKSVLTRLLRMKFNEIYIRFSDVQIIVHLENECTSIKLRVYRVTQNNNTLRTLICLQIYIPSWRIH